MGNQSVKQGSEELSISKEPPVLVKGSENVVEVVKSSENVVEAVKSSKTELKLEVQSVSVHETMGIQWDLYCTTMP